MIWLKAMPLLSCILIIWQPHASIKKVIYEVSKKPLTMRKSAVSALLWYTMRGTGLRFHSGAKQVLMLLLDSSIFGIGDRIMEGSSTVLEVLVVAFQRLCEEMDSSELCLMWDCLYEEIVESVSKPDILYLDRLLSLLLSTLQNGYVRKISDYEQMLKVIVLLVERFINLEVDQGAQYLEVQLKSVVDKILQLIICVIDGVSDDASIWSKAYSHWAPVFKLRNTSLLTFMKDLLQKEPCVSQVFCSDIICALNELVETFEEEVIDLLLTICEKQVQDSSFSSMLLTDNLINIRRNVLEATNLEGLSSIEFSEDRFARLWGIVCCYPYLVNDQADANLLLGLVNNLELLMTKPGFPIPTVQSLIATALASYYKVFSRTNIGTEESVVGTFLNFAKKYKSSAQILSSVADTLDCIYGSVDEEGTGCQSHHPELVPSKFVEALDVFAENLYNPNKEVRCSTLRILSHYEPLDDGCLSGVQLDEATTKTDILDALRSDNRDSNVVRLLLLIEATPLSVASSRKVVLLISKLQMLVSATRMSRHYIPLVLSGIFGIFHNRFSIIWDPALECLAVLVEKHSLMLWEKYAHYLNHSVSTCFLDHEQLASDNTVLSSGETDIESGLVVRFRSHLTSQSDSTPRMTVLTYLIRALQKVPSVSESRSVDIVPLFLKFLGYNTDDLVSVESFNFQICKGKDWKGVLKEWLNLFALMRNLKSSYRGQFLKEVLLFRLIDDNDPELQMKALDCLLNWKDEYLRPYDQHLKNLINAKTLREELTTWGLSPESSHINIEHRSCLVPVVIRLLVPKVRKLKSLSSRKQTSVFHRKAILGFLAQLDPHELPLFFVLLLKPLQTMPQEINLKMPSLYIPPPNEVDTISILKHFTAMNIKALSWKKLYGFMHVVEDVMSVFDDMHISPFLDLLMGCVVRVLESCMSTLETNKISVLFNDKDVSENNILVLGGNAVKQTKELRSLCLKVISFALTKYEDHDFGGEFWDLFFTSVKPLISCFKQEGASSERPSSLFSCFLAMSINPRIVPLLLREDNLIPDIFSMLTVVTASDAILSSVFKFIENLLNLDEQLGEDTSIKSILLPHVDILVSSIHGLFTQNNPSKRRMRHPGPQELGVFRLLSKYITESSAAHKFVDFLLPILSKKPQNSDVCMETLHTMRPLVILIQSGNNKKIMNSLSQLLTYADPEIRPSICDVIDALAQSDVSLVDVAKLIRELNPIPDMDMGDFDYETKFAAYDKVNIDLFFAIQEEHAILILSHAIWDLSSDEKTLRESAYRLFLCFIEFSGRVLDGRVDQDHLSHSRASVQHVLNNFILRHMGNAMNKEGPVQKMWIEILKEMVVKLPSLSCLEPYRALCSEDPEQDFFNNILHVQKHMRAKALSRFKTKISSENFSELILNKVFVPLFFNMLFNVQDGKGEHVRNSCLEALASVSGCLKWEPYFALLLRCFREMDMKPDKQKILLRLICSILDNFHFSESTPHGANESGTLDSDITMLHSSSTSTICSSSEKIYYRQTCLQTNLLPKIQKMLTSNSDSVNVNVSLVALKVLKLLPGDVLDSQLPSIIHCISNFLKNRQESVRDEARSALTACLKELGLEFLQFILKVLKSTLKRGFELHVLGYTLNFILSKFPLYPINGKLDCCLEDLLSVVRNDILGDVSEEKEVDKLASKMKETRKQKSFETLKLIAQSITFRTHATKLLSTVTINLKKHPTPKVKRKLEGMLKEITSGIQCNPSVNHTELFVFVYGLIKDGITDELCENESTVLLRKEEQADGVVISKETDRWIDVNPRYSHLITGFALGLLQSYMKKLKLNKKDEEMLSLLDPFVSLLGDCLTSKYENIVSAALRCLTPLVRLPLPSLESAADKIKNSLLSIGKNSLSSSSLMESCIGLLTGLLRGTRVTLSTDQLHMLIQFPLFIDLEKNPSFVALSLLKAIVNRKLVVPEIYDLVNRVAEIMVMSQVEPVRKKCSQILLQFLMDYHLSKKRLQQHLDFLLAHLKEGYEYSTGKEAVLEMLHAIIMKFPVSILDEQSQTVFLNLVLRLANDPDNKVRSMIGAVLKLLIGRVSLHSLQAILDYSLSWYLSEKQKLWSAGAQVLGLLVEVMKTGFQKHISSNLLEKMRSILLSAMHVQQDSSDNSTPFWKEAYYTLIMLEKLLHQFPSLILNHEFKSIWETICELLLHQHLWLRNISNRLLGIYFVAVSDARREMNEGVLQSSFLISPSRLFFIAASLCCQLKMPQIDDAAVNLITQNLFFCICGLDSSLTENLSENSQKLWSSISPDEQGRCLKKLLDPRGIILLASLNSDPGNSQNSDLYMVVSYLLNKLGKISLQMEPIQMKAVFNLFKLILPKLFHGSNIVSPIIEDDRHNHAYQILLPLYKVCEGYAGKIISDDVKQLAEDAWQCMTKTIGHENFSKVHKQIRKDLRGKREKRKLGEKIGAVVDPMGNAKRKLRLAVKNRAYKKRKIMTMKGGKRKRE
ncbi:hypothetical protein Leryth_004489 [Lithospermum erythrorhizon]|nr:hypothetical protein Leryth_004489 [Lithospermum erythrorhizon]